MELKNKVALVTGASRGIGKAIAISLAEKGANVVINYFKEKSKAHEVIRTIRQYGVECMAVRADVSKPNSAIKMIEKIIERFSRLDIVVNNAGIQPIHTHIVDIENNEWDRIMDVNLKGAFNVCKAVTKFMIQNKGGKIINISSIVGRMGSETGVAYAASKAGVIGLSLALATELASYGITVNVIAPGAIDTEWYSENEKEVVSKRCPLKRLGRPEEVAKAVIFLLEDDYLTGEIVNVDGGRSLRRA